MKFKTVIIIIALILFVSVSHKGCTRLGKINLCLDMNICYEGHEINTEYGRIKITKKNCEKYYWIWNDERKWCDLRSKD